MFKSSWLWFGSLASGLLVLLGTGVITQHTWVGPEWEWTEDPLTTLNPDQALVCVKVVDGPGGALMLRTQDSDDHLEALVFWDNQRGHCSTLPLEALGRTSLKPQLDQLFLREVTVTSWDNSWKTHSLVAEPGGWPVR